MNKLPIEKGGYGSGRKRSVNSKATRISLNKLYKKNKEYDKLKKEDDTLSKLEQHLNEKRN